MVVGWEEESRRGDYKGAQKLMRAMDVHVAMAPWACTNVRNDEIGHLKYVQFVACQLYLNEAV